MKLIKPSDLSDEDYIIEQEKNPLFFWKEKSRLDYILFNKWFKSTLPSAGTTEAVWGFGD